MIFLTVGTQFPFDRLVKSIDEFINQNGFEDEIFAQIGKSTYRPRNFEYVEFLNKKNFDGYVNNASGLISHAGIGIIMQSLDNSKPLLVMPRLRKLGEVVNDHQLAIAKKFEESGHILAAYSEKELPMKIKQLNTFRLKKRETQAHLVIKRISRFLNEFTTVKQGKNGTVL
jgi:beta-1,4-N-acetylglucosaminyltransferase